MSLPDLTLEPARLERALTEGEQVSTRWRVKVFDEVDSTMETASDEPSPQEDEVVAIIARRQRAGRGRSGKSWDSTRGALMTTLVFPWDRGVEELAGGSLVVGVGIAKALESIFQVPARQMFRLKWPNDILDPSQKKLCGVLIQNKLISGRAAICVGIGLNVYESPADVPFATDLRSVCKDHGLDLPPYSSLIVDLLLGVSRSWKEFRESGFGDSFVEQWKSRAHGVGQPVRIDTGQRVISGILEGITNEGALLVRTAEGVEEVFAGHVMPECT